MSIHPSLSDIERISIGYDDVPEKSCSLNAAAYTEPLWSEIDRSQLSDVHGNGFVTLKSCATPVHTWPQR